MDLGCGNKVTVAVVTPHYGRVGGAESYAFHLAEQLSAQDDFEIHVFAHLRGPERSRVIFHKVPIVPYPRSLRPVSFAYFSNALIRKGRFDLIHSHDRIFRMDVLTMHGIPHAAWVRDVRKKHMSLFDRATAWVERCGVTGSSSPIITSVSSLAKEEMLKCYEIPERRMKVIHPGVSRERFSGSDRDAGRREIRARHGLLSSDIVVLFVGLNYEIKRLDLAMAGMAELVHSDGPFQSAKLLIVGKTPSTRYLSLARSLGIADRCCFAGITREIEKYYHASDIFILPSSCDAFGMVVLEAMMAGLPVIITEKVGARDLVRTGVQGFVLKDHPSAADIAEPLAFLMKRENRLAMGMAARRTASDHGWEKQGRLLAETYRTLSRRSREEVPRAVMRPQVA